MWEGTWNRSVNHQADSEEETGRKISGTWLSKTQPEKQKWTCLFSRDVPDKTLTMSQMNQTTSSNIYNLKLNSQRQDLWPMHRGKCTCLLSIWKLVYRRTVLPWLRFGHRMLQTSQTRQLKFCPNWFVQQNGIHHWTCDRTSLWWVCGHWKWKFGEEIGLSLPRYCVLIIKGGEGGGQHRNMLNWQWR